MLNCSVKMKFSMLPGYAILPQALADDLNTHNDACPLVQASQAAALATLQGWAAKLAAELQRQCVKTFPSETYFFLADFAPLDAAAIAEKLKAQGIFIKALGDPELGPGLMRVTTALPEDNSRFLAALRPLLDGLGQAGTNAQPAWCVEENRCIRYA